MVKNLYRKKKIKVYLQRPWKFSDSPYYQYLRKNPPENIEYVNADEFDLIQSPRRMKLNNWLKRFIKKTIRKLLPDLPNAHITRTTKEYNLIHCAHCLSLNKKPWIVDIEYVNQFWAGGVIRNKNKVSRILMRNNCKKIIAWTKWSYDSIIKEFPEIKEKIEIVYPGIPAQKFKKQKSDRINLLFSSRRFYFKGGLHALEIINRLTKKYKKVYGIIVSDIPKEILEKYSRNKKIKFIGFIPKKDLFNKIYPTADIFVYPSYTDTFGFQLTEALSFGLPVISVGGQTRKEIIKDGKTGFVIDEPKNLNVKSLENLRDYSSIINELEKKTELLIKNKKLREKMSKNALKEISKGKFSIKERNKKLKRIYEEALKNDNR